jgi:hypothetical protein
MAYKFNEQDSGPVKIFRLPETGMVYTMGVDASTGLADDYSCIQVVSNTLPYEQVAIFRAKWPVNEVSKYVDMIGRFYNEALNVCEVNYPGNSVQDALLQYYKYPRNYQPETHLDEDVDISCKYGFRTTEASKWLLINEMQMALANKEIIINDTVTMDEMTNFVYMGSKRKAGAAEGFNDDTVMAFMLAYHGAKLYPFVIQKQKKQSTIITSTDPDTKKCWALFQKQFRDPRARQKAKQGVIQ